MRSKCRFILLSTLLIAPMMFALPSAKAQDDGADMPPPPPRGTSRDIQSSTVHPGDFGGSENERGFAGRRPKRFAEPGQRGNGGGMGGVGGPIDLRPLNLTDEQRQKIQTMRQATAEGVRQLRQNLRAQRGQLKDMMFDPKAADAQIKSKRQEVRALQDKMDELLVNDFLKMRAVLTKEQMSHLPETKPQMRNQMQRQMQRKRPGQRFDAAGGPSESGSGLP